MDITNMLNSKTSTTVAGTTGPQLQRQYAQINSNVNNDTGYPSPSHLQRPMSMLTTSFEERSSEDAYDNTSPTTVNAPAIHSGNRGNVKAFPCTTCNKAFQRRSDLARHERIHSGDRPHVCPEEGCKKPFIQRSALTVHMRVHSGEKPHMCERCGKPFSDSSSLARHRRIHSGKRPYQCPFADCQKTFTRRTTLTRHQNHHSGTVEEAAAATAAVLAARPPDFHQRAGSDGGNYSDVASMVSGASRTPSPSERNDSFSPTSRIPHLSSLDRQTSNLSYTSNDSLPPHMRAGLQQPSPRSSPGASSPSLSAFGGSSYHRPSLTSHPTLPVLEPPTYHELRQPGSGSGSPHLSSGGWQSPVHPSMPSPSHGDMFYPEPIFGAAMHLYYPNSNLRRPQSTEPDQYELRPRLPNNGGPMWTGSVS